MNDYSEQTSTWAYRVTLIQGLLADKKWAEAQAKLEQLQASLVSVVGWVEERAASN